MTQTTAERRHDRAVMQSTERAANEVLRGHAAASPALPSGYLPCDADAVPAGVRFDVDRREAGHIVQTAYGGTGSGGEYTHGDPWMRVTDASQPADRRATYYAWVEAPEIVAEVTTYPCGGTARPGLVSIVVGLGADQPDARYREHLTDMQATAPDFAVRLTAAADAIAARWSERFA